jgi:hypothetical protein
MREILPGIFTWGSTYADRPWDLNGYAIRLEGCTVLVDPPAPAEDDWPSFDVMKPIAKIVLTNRDHVRDADLFRTRQSLDGQEGQGTSPGRARTKSGVRSWH